MVITSCVCWKVPRKENVCAKWSMHLQQIWLYGDFMEMKSILQTTCIYDLQ